MQVHQQDRPARAVAHPDDVPRQDLGRRLRVRQLVGAQHCVHTVDGHPDGVTVNEHDEDITFVG